MYARIHSIVSYMPETELTNAEICQRFPEFTEAKILAKTGIRSRRISAPDVYASDLAVEAGRRFLSSQSVKPEEIDCLILCTQSPDHLLPSTATKVHGALGLRSGVATIDYMQGCSGYVHALGLAKGLIETGQVANVLLINADTLSKHIHPLDKSTLSLFGDAATATFITGDAPEERIGPFVYGTDAAGRTQIAAYRGGMRRAPEGDLAALPPEHQRAVETGTLYMNGPEVFRFTLAELPGLVQTLKERAGCTDADVDRYVFHQANGFMLSTIRQVCAIPEEKFTIALEDTGNTSSASIPLALDAELRDGRICAGQRTFLVGFGVGYSYAAAQVRF